MPSYATSANVFIQKQGRNNRLAGTLGSSKEHWSVVVETLINDEKPRAVFKYDGIFVAHKNLSTRRARFRSLKQIKKKKARLHKVENVTTFSLDLAESYCNEVRAGKLKLTRSFLWNCLVPLQQMNDTCSRFEFESEDMVVHSARNVVNIGYVTYTAQWKLDEPPIKRVQARKLRCF